MTVRLTPAQARKMGLDVKTKTKVRVRKTAKGAAYHTVCKTCGEEFHTEAAEDRHLKDLHHARYELVLGR